LAAYENVLVTGGAGFVGSNFCDHVLSNYPDSKVTIYDDFSRSGTEYNLSWLRNRYPDGKRLGVVRAALQDENTLSRAVLGKDLILHCAAQVAVTTSLADPRHDFNTNALGTLNLLEAARKSKSDPILLYCSTNKVYGELKGVPLKEKSSRYEFSGTYRDGIDESQSFDPCTPYGCSKAVGDMYFQDYAESYGTKSVVFRMSCIYGVHQYGTEDQAWISHFIVSLILGRPITIYGDGKQVRDILYINDLCRVFDLAAKRIEKIRGEVYNVGGGPQNTYSLLELIDYLEQIAGKKFSISYDYWRPADQRIYYSNISKAKRDFRWFPRISKETGVKLLYDWTLKNRRLFDKLYGTS
jgi:CDP-paratose 2-epimerase